MIVSQRKTKSFNKRTVHHKHLFAKWACWCLDECVVGSIVGAIARMKQQKAIVPLAIKRDPVCILSSHYQDEPIGRCMMCALRPPTLASSRSFGEILLRM